MTKQLIIFTSNDQVRIALDRIVYISSGVICSTLVQVDGGARYEYGTENPRMPMNTSYTVW